MNECPTCDRDDFATESGMKTHHSVIHGESLAGHWIECDWCGEEHHKRQLKDRNEHEFCSKECFSNYQSNELCGEDSHMWDGGKVKVECVQCETSVEKFPAYAEKGERQYCSNKCHAVWMSENQTGEDNPTYDPDSHVEVACDNCGDTVVRKRSKYERNERNFCDIDCRGEWQSEYRCGENHPRWIENPDHINYGGSWPEQREKRLEKDGHECVICSKSNAQEKIDKGRGLDVHHIDKARNYLQEDGTLDEEKAHRLENLITLCRSCHRRWEGIPLRPEVNGQ